MARRGQGQAGEHQLKIVLLGTKPPVWRRVVLASDATLGSLHQVIQRVFGWSDSHLHGFEDDAGMQYGAPEADLGLVDEESVSLADVAPNVGNRFDYTYDFGDNWTHRITVEKILPNETGERVARCVAGRRADPPAEDIGGTWGLAMVLAMLTDPDSVEPESGEEESYGELVAELREVGYDPAVFDVQEADHALDGLRLRTKSPKGRAPARRDPARSAPARSASARSDLGRLTVSDLEYCTCGRCRAGDPVRSVLGFGGLDAPEPDDLPQAGLVPAVELPPRAELAAAARAVPLVDAARRLAGWCGDGRKITAKGVLRPVLAREAVEELELWRLDEHLADPKERAARLGSLRSAGDLPIVDDPWQLAVAGGLIEVDSGTARRGAVDDEALLTGWAQWLVEELSALVESNEGGVLGMIGRMLPGASAMLIELIELLYSLPEGEWLDMGEVRSVLGIDEPDQRAVVLVQMLFGELMGGLAAALERLGAAEVEAGVEVGESLSAPGALMGLLFGSPNGPDAPLTGAALMDAEVGSPGRLRLTPLGRYGIREALLAQGYEAPLVGELAEADAAELLIGLGLYPPQAAAREVDGWLAHRSQSDAAVQVIDACQGTGADAAMRRTAALPVLVRLEEERALRVLRKAAASEVDGCRQVAAAALLARGEEVAGHDESTRWWLMIDTFAAMTEENMPELAEFLAGDGRELLPDISTVADDLWRSGHPSTPEVLAVLGEALRDTDKKLAKRLRASGNKARSRR